MPSAPDDREAPAQAYPVTFGPNGGSVVVGIVFGIVSVVSLTLSPSNPVVIVGSSATAVLAIVLVVLGRTVTLTVHADRLETTSWRRRRRVHRFRDVVEARVREGLTGAPRLTVRFRDGRRMQWNARQNSRMSVEPIIRCVHDALVAAGVPVDSRNQTGTGPFRDWVFPVPPPRADDAT